MYRGTQTTNLVGRYLFADFGSGRIWAWIAESADRRRAQPTQLLRHELSTSRRSARATTASCTSCNYGGTLHRIDFQGGGGGGTVPRNLERRPAASVASESDSSRRPG